MYRWYCCPQCGKKLLKVYPDTRAQNLHLYCKRCHALPVVTIGGTAVC